MSPRLKKYIVGILCLVVWQLSQFTHVFLQPVFRYLYLATALSESGYLLSAAFFLVLQNAFRAVILYNGWFLFAEGLSERLERRSVAFLLPLIMIPVSYHEAAFFSNRPHFSASSFLTLASVIILQFLCNEVAHYRFKVLIQSFLIFSIQWLDLIPALTHYGFGFGEMSMAVKSLSSILQSEDLLNVFSGLCFMCFFGTALLLAALFINYEQKLHQMELLRQNERKLTALRREQLESRLYREIQYLVHDLKRPLTAIIGLADVLSLNKDRSVAVYGKKIAQSAEKMDLMISEIRNPAAQQSVKFRDFLDYALSQVRPLPWGDKVVFEYCCVENVKIRVNQIRISRALVNLLDNAWHAVSSKDNAKVVLRAELDGSFVRVTVEDNGPGFLKVGEGEVSSWGGAGQGLNYVREAVSANHGEFLLENIKGEGLRCTLRFPAEVG